MQYLVLPRILDQEGPAFYRVDRRWQPKTLIPDPYRRDLLKDAQRRLALLEEAEDELQSLDRAPLFIGALKRMRLAVRQAQFAWRTDDLKFLQNVTEFYSDYGTVLRHLKIDQARGRLGEPATSLPNTQRTVGV